MNKSNDNKEAVQPVSQSGKNYSVTDSLTGAFKMPDNFNEKQELENALKEKYGLAN